MGDERKTRRGHTSTGNFLAQSEEAVKGQEKLNADVLAAIRKVCRVKKVTIVQDSVEVEILHPKSEIHIPIVGGSSHGKRMEFCRPPLPVMNLYCDGGLVDGIPCDPVVEREHYTLCYVLTEEMDKIQKKVELRESR